MVRFSYLPSHTNIYLTLLIKKNVLVFSKTYLFIQENYGRKDPGSVAKVKELYHSLNLEVSSSLPLIS